MLKHAPCSQVLLLRQMSCCGVCNIRCTRSSLAHFVHFSHKSDKSPCYKVEGEWTSVLYGRSPDGVSWRLEFF